MFGIDAIQRGDPRVVSTVRWRALLEHAALAEQDQPRAQARGEVHVMCRQHDGDVLPVVRAASGRTWILIRKSSAVGSSTNRTRPRRGSGRALAELRQRRRDHDALLSPLSVVERARRQMSVPVPPSARAPT